MKYFQTTSPHGTLWIARLYNIEGAIREFLGFEASLYQQINYQIDLLIYFLGSTTLSIYRSQNVLCWSKYFVPAQKFDCI